MNVSVDIINLMSMHQQASPKLENVSEVNFQFLLESIACNTESMPENIMEQIMNFGENIDSEEVDDALLQMVGMATVIDPRMINNLEPKTKEVPPVEAAKIAEVDTPPVSVNIPIPVSTTKGVSENHVLSSSKGEVALPQEFLEINPKTFDIKAPIREIMADYNGDVELIKDTFNVPNLRLAPNDLIYKSEFESSVNIAKNLIKTDAAIIEDVESIVLDGMATVRSKDNLDFNVPVENIGENMEAMVDVEDVFSQIKSGISDINSDGEVVIKLTPEGLGEITLKLVSVEGKTIVDISASKSAVKELLNNNLSDLKYALRPYEVQLNDVSYNNNSTVDNEKQGNFERHSNGHGYNGEHAGHKDSEENPESTFNIDDYLIKESLNIMDYALD